MPLINSLINSMHFIIEKFSSMLSFSSVSSFCRIQAIKLSTLRVDMLQKHHCQYQNIVTHNIILYKNATFYPTSTYSFKNFFFQSFESCKNKSLDFSSRNIDFYINLCRLCIEVPSSILAYQACVQHVQTDTVFW